MTLLKDHQILGKVVELTGTSFSINANTSRQYLLNMDADKTLTSITNLQDHGHIEITVVQDATGGRTFTLPASYVSAGSIDPVPNSNTLIHIRKIGGVNKVYFTRLFLQEVEVIQSTTEACENSLEVDGVEGGPIAKTNTVAGASVTGNDTGTFVGIELRGENDTGALDTPTAGIAQKVFREVTKTGCDIVDRVIVENYEQNTLYVDLTYGNNATGLRERSDRPFATLAAAVLSSQPGDTIILRDGDYVTGAVTIPHDLNIEASEGVVYTGSSIINIGANRLVHKGGRISNLTSGRMFTYSTGSIFDIKIGDINVTAGGFALMQPGSNLLIENVNGHIEFGTTYNIGTGNIIGLTLHNIQNSKIIMNGKSMNGSSILLNADSRGSINNCDIFGELKDGIHSGASIYGAIFRCVGTTGTTFHNNKISLIAEYSTHDSVLSGGTGNIYAFYAFREVVAVYDNDIYIKTNYLNTTRGVFWNQSEGDLFTIDGIKWDFGYEAGADNVFSMNETSYTGLNKKSRLVSLVKEISRTSITTHLLPAIGSGYGSGSTAIGLGNGFDADIYTKLLYNESAEVVGLDTGNPGVPLLGKRVVNFHGTKFVRGSVGVAGWSTPLSSYPGIIFLDISGVAGKDTELNFYNGCSFENNFDQYGIHGFAGPSQVDVIFHDQITHNNLDFSQTVDTITYAYQDTLDITAPGTFTVTTEANDYYYDLSLGSLTLVLPDPTKYINREIQLKITGLHPTNTVTIDPTGAFLINNAATRVVPNTATLYTGLTFKSQGGKRWISDGASWYYDIVGQGRVFANDTAAGVGGLVQGEIYGDGNGFVRYKL